MADKFMQLVLTPAVQKAQEKYFGRHQSVATAPERNPLTSEEAAFISTRESFYMASINSDDWPYIQHRGGLPGFLQTLEPNLLGFADLKGNRQLVTTGNLDGNDRVALFLMDYAHRERLKILGRARVLDARENPVLADRLSPATALRENIERIFLIDMISYDWNCSKYIAPRYTDAEIQLLVAPLKSRIAELEKQLRNAGDEPKT